MATTTTTTITTTLLVAAAVVLAATGAQPPAESPSPSAAGAFDCVNVLINMTECLTYVEAGSNVSTPDKACCPELAGLVESQPICLCQLLADPEGVIGIKIDLKKALNLPSVCKLNTPSASLCSAVGIPVGAPTNGALSPGGLPSSSSSPADGEKHDNATVRVAFTKKSFIVGLFATIIMLFATLS